MGRRWAPYVLLTPSILVLLALVIYPLIFAVSKSLHYYQLFKPQAQKFLWFDNYIYLLTNDTQFWLSLWTTLIFGAASVGAELVIGGLLAAWMFRYQHRMAGLRLLFLIPMLMAPVVVGLTWRFMYDPSSGIINISLAEVGITGINWLYSTSTSLLSVIITDVWQWTPFVFVVLFAGMMSLPPSVHEAARLDGASYPQFVWHVMIPMLRPIILIVVLIRAIDALRVFDQVYVLTAGGPGTSTYVLSYYDSVIGFHNYNIGLAAALAILIVLIISVLVLVLIRAINKELMRA